MNDWENSRIFGINKEPAHNTMIPYSNVNDALQANLKNAYYISLK